MITIRHEQPSDIEQIRNVNDLAFKQPSESGIVDKIRDSCQNIISLVALSEDKIVGHILFSPSKIGTPDGEIEGMGLAPLAVQPDFQNQGIGSMLAQEGIKIVKETECPFLIVLGHEKYYPRFGFKPASQFGLKCQWEGVPDGAFMAMIFDKVQMNNVSGIVRYRDEFNEAM